MKRFTIVDRLATGRLDRRAFLAALPRFGLVLASLPVGAPAARADGAITLFNWAGNDNPALFPAYYAKYGAPQSSFYADEYEAITKLRAGFKADIVGPCADVMPRWLAAGLKPIDESRLTNLKDLIPQIRDVPTAFQDGKRYFVPQYIGFAGIGYRTDRLALEPAEHSWKLLFDARFKGRLASWDSTDAAIPSAALALGFTDDPFRPSGARLDQVMDLLRKQHGLLRLMYPDPSSAAQAMASGDVDLMFLWTSTIYELRQQKIPAVFADLKERPIGFSCGLARGNGDGDATAVHEFLDASLSPEAGKYIIENWGGFGSANRKAYGMVDPAYLKSAGIDDPERRLRESNVYVYVPDALKTEQIRRFDEIRAGG